MPTFVKPTRIKPLAKIEGLAARGLVVSPYYPRAWGAYETTYMKAIAGLDYGVTGTGFIGVGFYTGSTLTDAQNLTFNMSGSTDALSLIAAAEAAINDYATLHSYNLSEGIYWPFPIPAIPAGLASAPQAAVANATGGAATGLQTNYNLATGVLGLANALNTANAAQNDLGTKFNDLVTKFNALLAEQRTLGLISS